MNDWQDQAACKGHPHPAMWFPEPHDMVTIRAAKAICQDCPVRQACLEYAKSNHEKHGIWGGESIANRYRRRGGFVRCGICGDEFKVSWKNRGYCSEKCAELGAQVMAREAQQRYYQKSRQKVVASVPVGAHDRSAVDTGSPVSQEGAA